MAWNDEKGNRHQRGYGTAWDKLRPQILARDSYLCQPCLKEDRLTPANIVDHMISKAKGGTDDPDNLQSICKSCHDMKTIEENGGTPKPYKAGSTESGQPIDPKHPWNT